MEENCLESDSNIKLPEGLAFWRLQSSNVSLQIALLADLAEGLNIKAAETTKTVVRVSKSRVL